MTEELGDPLPGFCHHILRHRNVFRACMVVAQLTIKNGEPHFEVKYED